MTMLTLPKHHAPVQEDVASILDPAIYLGNIYAASQIAKVLNAAVSNDAIDAS